MLESDGPHIVHQHHLEATELSSVKWMLSSDLYLLGIVLRPEDGGKFLQGVSLFGFSL